MSVLLILGGARSGKSRYGQARMEAVSGNLAYIATAQAFDEEMAERIAHHRADRGPRWHTVEAPLDLAAAVDAAQHGTDAILIDCLTLWVSNLLLAGHDGASAGEALCEVLAQCRVPVGLIANEVGLGIVPDNALARAFRDAAGWLNQRIAKAADEVVFVAAGLPLTLKPGG